MQINRLRDLAYNLWWSWTPAAQDLFQRVNPEAWQASRGNPVAVLAQANPNHLRHLASDPVFTADLTQVTEHFDHYLTQPTWFDKTFNHLAGLRVAYLSMEFGVTESVPLYSGGLGVLAGDHLKAASDLGVPIVGVGLLYQQGYFQQAIDTLGAQHEQFPDTNVETLPLAPARSPNGSPAVVRIPIDGHAVAARLWRMDVGRVPLILLDTNIPENNPDDRALTSRLYLSDGDIRIRQELLLGAGGMRALEKLGFTPTVTHMNEGHSAFLVLERFRSIRDRTGINERAAMHLVRTTNIFTTHTPVAAGHDEFSSEQVHRHIGAYLHNIGFSVEEALGLGRVHPWDADEAFGMTVLAMRGSSWRNAVSELHGVTSRQMWKGLWPDVPVREVPIRHVTNGVHMPTWVSREMGNLIERHLGSRWTEQTDMRGIQEELETIPDEEYWRAHTHSRHRLITNVRRRLHAQADRRGATGHELAQTLAVLNKDTLTIGFARRFAVYKRPTLVLHDIERLKALVTNTDRPIQIIFSGKSHPSDEMAKDLLREITAISRDPAFEGRLVFVEDYDMGLGRDLVQGCDAWLNLPIRPQEASGTSGMKAAANGVINIGVLDGWWDEAYTPSVGWAVGQPTIDGPEHQRNASDASALYDLLEHTVAPLFYTDSRGNVPAAWVQMSRKSMALALAGYSTNRMVREYVESFYVPAHRLGECLAGHGGARAIELTAWLDHVMTQWPHVRITEVTTDSPDQVDPGAVVPVRSCVVLPGLSPEDVHVQVYAGEVDQDGGLAHGSTTIADHEQVDSENTHWFSCRATLPSTGRVGIAVRVIPNHPLLTDPFDTGLIRWSEPASVR